MTPIERRGVKEEFGVYVVNRKTSKQEYEEQPLYLRIGMKALFGSWFVTSPFVRMQLQVQTVQKGKYDNSEESVKDIPKFIKDYKINMDELLNSDIKSYKTYNEFFYRKLKPGARPIDSPDDKSVVVSAADSRLTVFDSIDSATKLWIKGKNFNLENLFKDKELADKFQGGSLAIFRLAPQDYHRFHSPVDGKVVSIKEIPGDYYTVNPMAVKTSLDVFTENKRVVTLINSPTVGDVAFVSIGALMVGSINFTGADKVGNELVKGGEVGYFAFGGSTNVVVFQKGKVVFDDDLLKNSNESLETLVRMGEHIAKVKQ